MKKVLWLAVLVSGLWGKAQAQTGNWNFPQCTESVGQVVAVLPNGTQNIQRKSDVASVNINWSTRTVFVRDRAGGVLGAAGLTAHTSGNNYVLHAYINAGRMQGQSLVGMLGSLGNNRWRARLSVIPLSNTFPLISYDLIC